MRRLAVLLILLLGCHRAVAPPAPKVIFVGLDGADWQLLDRFMADGTMPNLARLARYGDRRVLRTQHPPLSPLVWTTMMTGVSPLEHRILDFTRFNPATREREPITSDERAVPAIWNMASSSRKKVDVFGLWATYPAETINGTIVSDRLFTFQFDAPPAPGCVSPPSEETWARGRLGEVLAGADHTMRGRIVTETELIHRLATERIAKDRPDLAVVYFQGTDAIGHVEEARVDDVVRKYFARIDAIVGDYARLARDEHAQLILASDHGFDWGGTHGSATGVATAAQWHRDEGIFLEWPSVILSGAKDLSRQGRPRSFAVSAAQDDKSRELRVDQICSILLDRLGLPTDVGQYRRAFRRARIAQASGANANEKVSELKALGYIGSAEPSRAPAGSTSTRTAASFDNEALLLEAAGREDDAIVAFTSALDVDPGSESVKHNFGSLLVARGRHALEAKRCDAALAEFRKAEPMMPKSAIVQASIGTAQLCLGDVAAAHRAFARSLELDPGQPQLHRLLGY